MKKGLPYIIPCLCLLISCSKQQVAPDQLYSFMKFYGNNKTSTGIDVKQLADGSYITIANSTNNSGKNKMFVIKTDKFGNELWHKMYPDGNDLESVGKSILPNPDGSFLMLGSINEINIPAIYLVKTDNKGDTLWTKKYSNLQGTNYSAKYFQFTSDGNLLMLINKTSSSYLVLTDSEGNIKWESDLSSLSKVDKAFVNIAKGFSETSDYYVVAGETKYSSVGNSDIALFMFSKSDGSFSFMGNSESIGDDHPNELKKLSDSIFLCIGTNNNRIFLTKFRLTSNGSIIKTLEKTFGSESANSEGKGLVIVSDTLYAIVGNQYRAGNSNVDISVLLVNDKGELLNSKTHGESGNQTVESISATADGGFILTGTNSNSNFSVITLIKTKSNGGLY